MTIKVRKRADAKKRYDCVAHEFALSVGRPHPSREYLAALRPIWECCGSEIMDEWMESRANPGFRPFGWWMYDAPCERDCELFPNEWDYLAEHGLLEPWEYDAIDQQWVSWFGREYFNDAENR